MPPTPSFYPSLSPSASSTDPAETTASDRSPARPADHSRAAQVCATCKARKKKCDKALPRCSFCVQKGLRCAYHDALAPTPTPVSASTHDLDLPLAAPLTSTRPLHFFTVPASLPAAIETDLHLRVQHSIRASGLFLDDVSSRYFDGIHRYIPVISRPRFQHDLIGPGTVPSAGFSVLLLAMCLVHSSPALERSGQAAPSNFPRVDYDSLHLTATALFAQVQSQCPPSLYLLQAGLLLAIYEYLSGRPDKAFTSIACCARMAYAARIHVCNQPSPQPPWRPIDKAPTALAYKLQVQEAANTWWGIIISERTFFSDITVTDQPLVASHPGGNAHLPIGLSLLERDDFLGTGTVSYTPVSHLTSSDVESFGRAAQAAWLLDQVIKAFDIPDIHNQLFQLQGLDTALQSFLAALMQQSSAGQDKCCEAIAITIRALFALHWRIVESEESIVQKHQPQQHCCKSHAALNTAINIVLDIVEAHKTCTTSCTAPSLPYLIQAALNHVYRNTKWGEEDLLRSAEERLRTSLGRFVQRCDKTGL